MRPNASVIANSNVKKLGEVCKIINGFFFPKSVLQLIANQVPYAKATDIVVNHLTSTNASVLNKLVQKRNAEIANKGAFLIVLTGASIGQIATLDIDAILDPNLCAVINEWLEDLDNQFLYFFLLVNVPFLRHHTKTSDRIQSIQLKDLTIRIPPIATQRKLVKEVSEKITRIDAAIHTLQQQVATAKVEKQQIIDNAFTHDISIIATQINRINLSLIANIQAGNTPTESMAVYYANEYAFFKPEDIFQGDNMLTSKTQVSARGAKVARLIMPNALLVVTSGSLIGKVGITRIKATCNRSLTAIMPYKDVSTDFLYFQFQSQAIQNQIRAAAIRSIITKSKLSAIQCIIVPTATQSTIIKFLQKKLQIINANIRETQTQIDKLTQEKEHLLIATFRAE